jgi:hypothetical protein
MSNSKRAKYSLGFKPFFVRYNGTTAKRFLKRGETYLVFALDKDSDYMLYGISKSTDEYGFSKAYFDIINGKLPDA